MDLDLATFGDTPDHSGLRSHLEARRGGQRLLRRLSTDELSVAYVIVEGIVASELLIAVAAAFPPHRVRVGPLRGSSYVFAAPAGVVDWLEAEALGGRAPHQVARPAGAEAFRCLVGPVDYARLLATVWARLPDGDHGAESHLGAVLAHALEAGHRPVDFAECALAIWDGDRGSLSAACDAAARVLAPGF